MSTAQDIERTATARSAPHNIATSTPDFVRREVHHLKYEGCTNVEIDNFDRSAAVWAITFERDGERLARLLWCMEVLA